MTRWKITAAVVGLVLLSTTACTPTDTARDDCLAQTPKVTLQGERHTRYSENLAANTVVDARSASFRGWVLAPDTPQDPKNAYPVVFEGAATGVCFVDGSIWFNDPHETSDWGDVWHKSAALFVDQPSFTAVQVRIDNTGDGVTVAGDGTDVGLIGVRMTRVHDDCVEDDAMENVLIDDSYLECYSGISARGWTSPEGNNHTDGSLHTLTIQDTLIHAKAMPETYLDNGLPGHIGWFKFPTAISGQGKPPKLILKDVVLRADSAPLPQHFLDLPPKYSDPAFPGVPQDWPMECENVTIVWTGPGAFPGALPANGCAQVTTDVGVWNTAVADYDSAHPGNL